ncbi:MAG TPA: adenylate/guanylate cyclase domain-containing protein, partial [Caldithrix sp.]|nr:adenylate/guanylate cyclase domain-containing protein [Caldithrix sp.]
IDIDERSNQELGKYSLWPRKYHSDLVKFLADSGALAIGLDILYDPFTWQPEQDEEFIQTIKEAGNVYLAVYFGEADTNTFRYAMNSEPDGYEAERFYYQLPLKEMDRFRHEERFESNFVDLINAGRGNGHVNFNADIDGVVRRIHLFSEFNNHLYPSLSFKMYMDLIGADSIAVNEAGNFELFRQGETISNIPVDSRGNMLINYAGGYKTFRYIPFYDVLKQRVPGGFFNNKIVFVGTSLAGLFDLRNVPFMQTFPGVEIHTNILYTLLKQDFVRPLSGLTTFLIMAAFGIIMGIVLSFIGPLWSFIILLIVGLAHILISLYLFTVDSIWVEIVSPILTLFLTFSFVYVYRYLTEEKNKRFIRNTFSHFVTKSVVDELLANPDKIKLGGEKKICTVFFSDIAGFTTISEQLSPEELVRLLNEYLTEMTGIVFKYNGMLDKYEGDAIMAVFGAPIAHGNHAYNACRTALDMQVQLIKMRDLWRKQNRPQLKCRIGINTGPMVVGNMGSETRFDYTVMGDAVNLGARLEPANKEYNSHIIIGDETYQMAKDLIIARPLDLLRVKGRGEPVSVYELLGTKEEGAAEEMLQAIEYFNQGFQKYLAQNWDEAIDLFQKALSVRRDDGPAKRYIQRCQLFRENPPGADWDGVFTMTHK